MEGGAGMIDKAYGRFELTCDVCGDGPEEAFDSFQDAVDHMRAEGWRSTRSCGEVWINHCKECVEATEMNWKTR